jgi:hypothetical protein
MFMIQDIHLLFSQNLNALNKAIILKAVTRSSVRIYCSQSLALLGCSNMLLIG